MHNRSDYSRTSGCSGPLFRQPALPNSADRCFMPSLDSRLSFRFDLRSISCLRSFIPHCRRHIRGTSGSSGPPSHQPALPVRHRLRDQNVCNILRHIVPHFHKFRREGFFTPHPAVVAHSRSHYVPCVRIFRPSGASADVAFLPPAASDIDLNHWQPSFLAPKVCIGSGSWCGSLYPLIGYLPFVQSLFLPCFPWLDYNIPQLFRNCNTFLKFFYKFFDFFV